MSHRPVPRLPTQLGWATAGQSPCFPGPAEAQPGAAAPDGLVDEEHDGVVAERAQGKAEGIFFRGDEDQRPGIDGWTGHPIVVAEGQEVITCLLIGGQRFDYGPATVQRMVGVGVQLDFEPGSRVRVRIGDDEGPPGFSRVGGVVGWGWRVGQPSDDLGEGWKVDRFRAVQPGLDGAQEQGARQGRQQDSFEATKPAAASPRCQDGRRV